MFPRTTATTFVDSLGICWFEAINWILPVFNHGNANFFCYLEFHFRHSIQRSLWGAQIKFAKIRSCRFINIYNCYNCAYTNSLENENHFFFFSSILSLTENVIIGLRLYAFVRLANPLLLSIFWLLEPAFNTEQKKNLVTNDRDLYIVVTDLCGFGRPGVLACQ